MQFCKNNSDFRPKDRTCGFSRFLSVVSRPMECLKEWAFDKFERTAVALELGFLRGMGVRISGDNAADERG